MHFFAGHILRSLHRGHGHNLATHLTETLCNKALDTYFPRVSVIWRSQK